jgi:hypothetical protein
VPPGLGVTGFIVGWRISLELLHEGESSHAVKKLEVRTLRLSELRGWAKNPRKIGADARAGLRASLQEFGCVQPIVVNRIRGRWEIVGGHQRHRELLEIGATAAACVVVRPETSRCPWQRQFRRAAEPQGVVRWEATRGQSGKRREWR